MWSSCNCTAAVAQKSCFNDEVYCSLTTQVLTANPRQNTVSIARRTVHRLQSSGKAAQRKRLNGLKIANQDYTSSALSTTSQLPVRFRFQITQLLGKFSHSFPKTADLEVNIHCRKQRLLACPKASAAFCISSWLCWAVTFMQRLAGVLVYALSRSDNRCTVKRTSSF